MISILAAVAFGVIVVGVLLRFGRLPVAGRELVLAAALVGFAGYLWQGVPSQAGAPVAPPEDKGFVPPDPEALATRQRLMNPYGEAPQVMAFADTLQRYGKTQEAVIAVKTGLRKDPNNSDLWVTLGNALVAHGGNTSSPAAELAFDHAASLDPKSPAPAFYKGQAFAQSGRFDDAAKLWQTLLARSPTNARWRKELELRLSMLEALRAQ